MVKGFGCVCVCVCVHGTCPEGITLMLKVGSIPTDSEGHSTESRHPQVRNHEHHYLHPGEEISWSCSLDGRALRHPIRLQYWVCE